LVPLVSKFNAGNKLVLPTRKVAIYSSADHLDTALAVAKEMSKQDLPRIYVIDGGYEALVKEGFKLKEKSGFEQE
jgi:hypothetical protein